MKNIIILSLFFVTVGFSACSKPSVNDPNNNNNVSGTKTDTVINKAPQIVSLSATPSSIRSGQTATLKADAVDSAGYSLSYAWTSQQGAVITGSGSQVSYTAFPCCGSVTDAITCTVNDGKGSQASATVNITVSP